MRNERLEKGIPAGAGAAAYAKALFAGMSHDEIEQAMPAYLDGEMRDSNDKRVKDCAYCGYLYRDATKPNNSKTCSPECKAGLDAERKREKRHAAGQFNRYPAQNYEVLCDHEKLERIHAARYGYEEMGGRRGRYAEQFADF